MKVYWNVTKDQEKKQQNPRSVTSYRSSVLGFMYCQVTLPHGWEYANQTPWCNIYLPSHQTFALIICSICGLKASLSLAAAFGGLVRFVRQCFGLGYIPSGLKIITKAGSRLFSSLAIWCNLVCERLHKKAGFILWQTFLYLQDLTFDHLTTQHGV